MRTSCKVMVILGACLTLSGAANATDHSPDINDTSAPTMRPKLTLAADRLVGIGPTRVRLIARLVGGSNENAEFHCPTLVWSWGDGTRSESSADCRPGQAASTGITRTFTTAHVFQGGDYHVEFQLVSGGKAIASARTEIRIIGEPFATDEESPVEADLMGGPRQLLVPSPRH